MSADDKSEKERPKVPPMETGADGKYTTRGLASHAEAVRTMYYDKERGSFRDPNMVTLALLLYAIRTASRLAETEDRLSALEKKFEAFEVWREDTARDAKEAFEQIEKEMAGASRDGAGLPGDPSHRGPGNGKKNDSVEEVQK